ncbi:MAG: hypothetical protein GF365_02445 [Candidatus Buchananbacteria bacterium]|nr:hypothetical protein [Candidatus Buchananbacteria bacterium]
MLHYWQVAVQYAETGTVPEHVAIAPFGVLLILGVVLIYGLIKDFQQTKGEK